MEQEKRNRIILIGPVSSGKTTLSQRITNREIVDNKTQALSLIDDFIFDTPGEYLEMVHYRGAITVTSAEADIVIFVQNPIEDDSAFPPAYASLFCKPVFGVITKSDVANKTQIKRAKKQLEMAGAQKVFVVSSITGEGIDDFVKAIDDKWEGSVKQCLAR